MKKYAILEDRVTVFSYSCCGGAGAGFVEEYTNNAKY
jgi:hypothetical protein